MGPTARATAPEDLMAPFTVRRRGALRTLTPIHVTSAPDNAELHEASISLFHHVLPGVGRKFMRKLFANPQAQTILLLQSAEGARARARATRNEPWPQLVCPVSPSS